MKRVLARAVGAVNSSSRTGSIRLDERCADGRCKQLLCPVLLDEAFKASIVGK
jgi:hypothetical protein